MNARRRPAAPPIPRRDDDGMPPTPFPGWHDSSLELKRGLVVTEHGGLDEVDALPLAFVATPPRADFTHAIHAAP